MALLCFSAYFRFEIVLRQAYVSAYRDKMSDEFKELNQTLFYSFNSLFEGSQISGTQRVTVGRVE